MRWSVLGLAVFLLCTPVVSAEFVVKYFIDGHIFAGGGTSATDQNWCVDMDGDSSPEMLVFGQDYFGDPFWVTIGIAHVATGETQWFTDTETGRQPCRAVVNRGRFPALARRNRSRRRGCDGAEP